MEEELWPTMNKVKNGHLLQVFPVYEQGEGMEEIAFWCHSCDLPGEKVITIDLRERDAFEAYKELVSIAEWHAEQ
jgi:hypothetical protein